jgi:ferredoxin
MPSDNKNYYDFKLFFEYSTYLLLICPVLKNQIILKICNMAYVINDECTACGTCIDECPVEAITEGDIYVIDAELCTDCGACADVCPVEAISPE